MASIAQALKQDLSRIPPQRYPKRIPKALIEASPQLLRVCELMLNAQDAQQMETLFPLVRRAVERAKGLDYEEEENGDVVL